MTMNPFLDATHVGIDDRATIAAMEQLFAAIAGLIAATGGSFAIAGRDIRDQSVPERALRLTAMYEAGEVVVGYADARNGDVVNIVIEHLLLRGSGPEGCDSEPCWRALVYVEECEGHVLRGALSARRWAEVAGPLFEAVSDGLRRPLPSRGAATAAMAQAGR